MNDKIQRIVLTSMLVIIIILICISCYLLGVARGRSEIAEISDEFSEHELRSTVVNKDNLDNVSAGFNGHRNGPQSYEVIMNTEWEFADDGKRSSNAYVENSRENNNTVYFTIALESQPDKTIYRSPEIRVGEKLKGIVLSEAVPKGRSKAIVTYRLLDDRGRTTGEVKAGVTLVYGE